MNIKGKSGSVSPAGNTSTGGKSGGKTSSTKSKGHKQIGSPKKSTSSSSKTVSPGPRRSPRTFAFHKINNKERNPISPRPQRGRRAPRLEDIDPNDPSYETDSESESDDDLQVKPASKKKVSPNLKKKTAVETESHDDLQVKKLFKAQGATKPSKKKDKTEHKKKQKKNL